MNDNIFSIAELQLNPPTKSGPKPSWPYKTMLKGQAYKIDVGEVSLLNWKQRINAANRKGDKWFRLRDDGMGNYYIERVV